ncbi:hypothetical protein [Alkaliphilus serpentinus]|uniref:PLD phosphodiesterase domain-containing protein n=1 Tax=Alkaliphilus serpentinus TaxID=1482731 RepID=A0A833M9I2_9FIRM|nr:hypothetical protein [Alkaliphilus serpentinus]KAB3529880.1 hypothetical protein F8153_08760 [Alkaliphilus serpentinus]
MVKLITGKEELIKTIRAIVGKSRKVHEILLSSIFDEDIFNLINSIVESQPNINLRFLISHLDHKLYFLERVEDYHKHIRVNAKCRYKFIMIEKNIFFISGSYKDKDYNMDGTDLILHLKGNKQFYDDFCKMVENCWETALELDI